ncbi:DUF1697 domain-containing protein [Dysgonomonas sp. HGC4]|uniref:DUF1697 domain-containing protein n=1 Tax=Dysgonomonas sp. HGC4 TaxID=1658009 RepID=UPI00067FA84A|nr:DUF1697 domain-containing protein [Dysgonomonas sp. HGC4]MBD8348397.1 DUF1697 domain-containing protein [Dysgonomonas sp. HGC4]
MNIEDSSKQTYISMLRGINVGGHRKIKMDDLKILYENLQLENVMTYIQSGNVVFQSNIQSCKALSDLISKQIHQQFQLDVPVIVKSIEEFNDVYENNPFVTQNKDTEKLYIIFLSENINEPVIEEINKYAGDDLFIIYKSAIYLFCTNGYGKTKLTNTFFEKKLKILATTRGWTTVSKLREIAKSSMNK